MRSTQAQQKRISAERWYHNLQQGLNRYSCMAYDLKRKGFTYCQIMDYFAGKGFK